MSQLFTIERHEFLNKYYDSVKTFAAEAYAQIVATISSGAKNKYLESFLSKKEIGVLLVILLRT